MAPPRGPRLGQGGQHLRPCRLDQTQLDPEVADRAIAHLGQIIRARLQTAKETQT